MRLIFWEGSSVLLVCITLLTANRAASSRDGGCSRYGSSTRSSMMTGGGFSVYASLSAQACHENISQTLQNPLQRWIYV